MKVDKKVLAELPKCYAIAPLRFHGEDCFLVAAEKVDRCLLFDAQGNIKDTVWSQPGGVMSMRQLPGSDGAFLATHKFYSPNDSAEAKIVLAEPGAHGWKVRTLVALPFVHRFDILESGGIAYLIACTLKSGHAGKDDFSSPGKVYAAALPQDLSAYNESNPLPLTMIADGLTKNHGFCLIERDGVSSALISAQNGVFSYDPPAYKGGAWRIKQLLDTPTSDAVLVDFDGDGQDELLTIEPFHGDSVHIYKKSGDGFTPVYAYEPAEFSHAIFGGTLLGQPAALVGHRKGARDLVLFHYDSADNAFKSLVLDHDVGPANVYCYEKDGKDIIISTNREIDEVAMYILSR